MKLSPQELANRIRAKVYLTDQDERTELFGEPVQVDSEGQKFVVFPAHPELKAIVRDLHPTWTLTDDFIDMTGLEEEKKPEEKKPEEKKPEDKPSLSKAISEVAKEVK